MAENIPKYSVRIITGDGTKYNVTGALTDLQLAENEGQLAQKATIKFVNLVHNGSYLSSLFDVINRVFVYATYEGETKEVFRGFTWDKDYMSSLKKELTLICYDNLIYLMKSEICKFFKKGTNTETICKEVCSDWGIGLNYEYKSISHPKLPLEGSLGDILTSDVLDEVKKQTGVKYVLRSSEDTLYIKTAGSNSKIYEINTKQNSGDVRHKKTMDEVVTQVIITGKKGNDDRTPIVATVKGDTDKYGTIQKSISKKEDTSINESKKEAREMIDENGNPKETIYLDGAVDIPFVHKGDIIKVNAGDIVSRYCLVNDVTHNGLRKTMSLVCEFYDMSTDSDSGNKSAEAGKTLRLSVVPLYISSDALYKSTNVTGTYYLYDGIEILGRYRITNSQSRVGAKPIDSNVTGWIDKEYV